MGGPSRAGAPAAKTPEIRSIKGLRLAGKSLGFSVAYGAARLPCCTAPGETAPRHPTVLRNARQEAPDATTTGVDEVSSISYLPQTFTTLFFLAASLLLGLMR